MRWYWIGTKICETKNNVWKRYGLSIHNSIDNYIKITQIKPDSASLNNLKCFKNPVIFGLENNWQVVVQQGVQSQTRKYCIFSRCGVSAKWSFANICS